MGLRAKIRALPVTGDGGQRPTRGRTWGTAPGGRPPRDFSSTSALTHWILSSVNEDNLLVLQEHPPPRPSPRTKSPGQSHSQHISFLHYYRKPALREDMDTCCCCCSSHVFRPTSFINLFGAIRPVMSSKASIAISPTTSRPSTMTQDGDTLSLKACIWATKGVISGSYASLSEGSQGQRDVQIQL